MSFHWASNGTPANEQLKTYLDPLNTGVLVYNGSFNPCSGAGVEENELASLIGLYPNPASNNITLDLSALEGQEFVVTVVDITGKIMHEQWLNKTDKTMLSVEYFAKGLYFIRIGSGNTLVTKEFIKD
jgi:hypothetical protein